MVDEHITTPHLTEDRARFLPGCDRKMVRIADALGVTAGFLIASLFFLRFWKDTRDRLFLSFALAFMLLGLHQALLVATDIPVEERSPLYVLRLMAFALIIWSIIQKSRRS